MLQQYDYIIAGAGASGLSLAWQMLHSPLANDDILIVDADLEPKNDKTWCFWHPGEPPFAEIIRKKWSRIEIGTHDEHFSQQLHEYPYYGLRSIDFEEKILAKIQEHNNFQLLEKSIHKLTSSPDKNRASLHTETNTYEASYIFQSCFDPLKIRESHIQYPLKQHFLGWEITTPKPVFDDSTCTLMDFDENFTGGVAFMYLLPWNNKSGLFEYTIFSDQLVSQKRYEEKISLYLHNRFNLKPIDYTINRREYGVIPMEDRPAIAWYKPRILNIGTQGGLTKPSTGYTFTRIQNQARAIVEQLVTQGEPKVSPPSKKRFQAYDLWFLQILHDSPDQAPEIFRQLFQNNSIDEVFRFLNEDSSLLQDLKIMNSVPYRPFLQAIWETRNRLKELQTFYKQSPK